MKSFKDLGISDELRSQLVSEGIKEPTIVQEKVIPLIINGEEVLVQSETGSGKTIGFAVPVINSLKHSNHVQALVITPTRELARQVNGEFKRFCINGLKNTVVYGGVSIEPQIKRVNQSDIVVGTPGRLLDLIRRGALKLDKAEYLILDEADRMLDMGFIDDIKKIIKRLPENKQSLLFSATMNGRVMKLSRELLSNPKKIMLNNVLEKGILKQYYYDVRGHLKLSLLVHLLKDVERDLSLVFCNTKHSTEFVTRVLRENGIKADCMSSNLSQHAREKVLKKFDNGGVKVLVATDVAARGLDIDDITHVINFDVPNTAEDYTHRIGRTARNGKTGTAIILLSERDHPSMYRLQRDYDGKIERKEMPYVKRVKMPNRKPKKYKKHHHRK